MEAVGTTGMVLAAAGGFVLLLVLIIHFKLNAAIAILLSTIFIGVCAGMPLASLTGTMIRGVGSLLENLTLIIGLGCMLGAILEVSGGVGVITISSATSGHHGPWRWRG